MEPGHGDEATMRDAAAGVDVPEANLPAAADPQAEKPQPAEGQQSPVSPMELRKPLPPDPSFNFKPRPMQWPFLVSLVVIILSLIALTEYACRVLPANEDSSASAVPPSPSSPPAAVATAVAVPPRAVPSPALPLRKRQQRDPITVRNETTIASRTPITRTLLSRTLLSSSETDTIPSRTRQALTPSGTLDAASESKSPTKSHKVPWPGGVRSGSKTEPGAFATDGDVTLTSTLLRDAGPTTTPSRQIFASKVTVNRGGQNRGGPTQQQEQQPTVLIGGGPTLSQGPAQTQPASASDSGGSNEGEAAALTTLDGVVTTITGGFFSSLTSTVTVDGVVTTETRRIFQPSTSTATLDGVVVLDVDYVTPQVKTLRDSSGAPTATTTLTPPPIYTPTVITLYGPDGVPTATVSTSAAIPPLTTVLADGGAPAATLTEYPVYHNASIPAPATSAPQPGASAPQPQTVQVVYHITKLEYFVGFFLPPLLSVSLTILIRILDLSAKQLQPFHELTYARGATAAESLCLQTSGLHGIAASVRSLFGGRVLVFLTTLLLLCSAFLVPLSSEAVALKLHGSCATNSFSGCAMTLAVFPEPATATMALLGLMALLTLIIALFLARWRSGVAANPWSIAGIASLSTNPAVRSLLLSARGSGAAGGARLSNRQLASAFDGGGPGQQGIAAGSRRFKLAYFRGVGGQPEYGIIIVGDNNEDDADSAGPGAEVSPPPLPLGRPDSLASAASSSTTGREVDHEQHPPARQAVPTKNQARSPPFAMLSYTGRVVFVALLLGLLVVILYYNQTYDSTSFEAFLDSQGFGVRFLFTAIGVIVTFFWSSFFTNVAILSPYCLLSSGPQPAERSILLTPPTHALLGIGSALRRRHFFLVVVAIAAITAEFMPILLNNVPFRVTQTWVTHQVCTWMAVGILCFMILIVAGSFFVEWPQMPVAPSTVGGAMYYICESTMLSRLDDGSSLSTLDGKERRERVQDLGARYSFGQGGGTSEHCRAGVDVVGGKAV